MLKKLLLVATCIVTSSHAMDTQQKLITIPDWVHNTKQILVLRKNKRHIKITIDEDTTISDVKDQINCHYLISENSQELTAVWKSWWPTFSGWALNKSEPLNDTLNVKQLMAHYNTSMLQLRSSMPG